jgi:hypothetical protein
MECLRVSEKPGHWKVQATAAVRGGVRWKIPLLRSVAIWTQKESSVSAFCRILREMLITLFESYPPTSSDYVASRIKNCYPPVRNAAPLRTGAASNCSELGRIVCIAHLTDVAYLARPYPHTRFTMSRSPFSFA